MDAKLRREISRRVAEHKQGLEDSEAMRAHIAALAEVYDVDLAEVEAIAAQAALDGRAAPPKRRRLLDAFSKVQIFAGLVAAAIILAVGGWLSISGLAGRTDMGPPGTSNMLKASIVSTILASASPLRMMVTEFYMTEGQYPSKFEELGLDRDDMRTADYVEDIVLGPKGEIIIKSDDAPGETVYVVLYPEQTMGGLNTSWRCLLSTKIEAMRSCEEADVSGYISKL